MCESLNQYLDFLGADSFEGSQDRLKVYLFLSGERVESFQWEP